VPAEPIYLDYNATTPVDGAVLDAMLPFLRERFGNPSSQHAYGRAARIALDHARADVASLIGALPDEVVFTGGGTEATNHALQGLAADALARPDARRPQIVVSAVEHPATLETARFLERLGFRLTVIEVDGNGRTRLDAIERALREPTLVLSLMHANNETGTLQPVVEAARLAHERGTLVHVDAAQSAGKVPVDVAALGADLLSIAGHKLYAPKGVGALYVRRGVQLAPLVHGAGQESGRRAGTENVPYAVGLGTACRIAHEALPGAAARMGQLRDRLWSLLASALGDQVVRNGHPEQCLPNTLNVGFVGRLGTELLAAAPEIAASTGSACHDGRVTVSPVLAAMGVAPAIARGAVRLSVGRHTTEAEIDRAAAALVRAAQAVPRNTGGTTPSEFDAPGPNADRSIYDHFHYY
jgi:cysteine desulfurase